MAIVAADGYPAEYPETWTLIPQWSDLLPGKKHFILLSDLLKIFLFVLHLIFGEPMNQKEPIFFYCISFMLLDVLKLTYI